MSNAADLVLTMEALALLGGDWSPGLVMHYKEHKYLAADQRMHEKNKAYSKS